MIKLQFAYLDGFAQLQMINIDRQLLRNLFCQPFHFQLTYGLCQLFALVVVFS